jgi:hypothetical protein
MRDIQADWKRWSRGEKRAAIAIALALVMALPALVMVGAT